jgi:hypothetical protein
MWRNLLILQFQPDCGTRMSIKNQRGIALMTVIVFLSVMSLTWLSFSFISTYESDVLQKQVASERASYVAEAGIQQALYFLSQDWNWQNWVDNKGGNGGTRITDGTLIYYQWSGNLGDSYQTYTVQIRNDGKIQSKIRVGSPDLNPPSRIIEVELGSAFDYGLYSHKNLEFRNRSFTVSGNNQKGYVYSKDDITAGSSLLTANKITGSYSTAPWYLPKEIPLPELWKTKIVNPQTGNTTWVGFEAKINGTPTATIVRYSNDNGEDKLKKGALLHNKTKGNFRKISSTVDPDSGSNTITTEASVDNWANGDKIVVERVEVYENYWNTLNTQLTNIITAGAMYPPPSSSPPYTNLTFTSDTCFTPTPTTAPFTVQFWGNTTFAANTNIIIDGNAIFGRLSAPNGATTISGNLVVKGNAYFFNQVNITGCLYVVGSVYMFDNNNLSSDYYQNHWLFLTPPDDDDWREYFKTADYDNNGNPDFDLDGDGVEYTEINPYVDTGTSTSHGITVAAGGGVFVMKSANIQEFVNSGSPYDNVKINGYFYVNNDVKIYHGCTSPSLPSLVRFIGLTIINNYNNPVAQVFYVRNGSLTLGNADLSWYRITNLQGSGRIIGGGDIAITNDLYAPQSNAPLFIASGGNLNIGRKVGASGNPFYGMVYVGENANIVDATTMSGGLLVVNKFDPNRPYLSGSSIAYQDYKSLLPGMGFTNNRDFPRPLFWRDTTE